VSKSDVVSRDRDDVAVTVPHVTIGCEKSPCSPCIYYIVSI